MKAIASTGLFLLLIASFFVGFFYPTPTQLLSNVPGSSSEFSVNSPLPDFSQYADVQKKKTDFFAFLLPKIKQSNTNILKERNTVLNLIEKLPQLSKSELSTLAVLKTKYEVELDSEEEALALLKRRVDIIPASLALAQAANESAWGTSRFARKGNNLFGQWCYVQGCGIIPKQRHGKQRHEVAKFNSILDSIESYMRNLNSQAAYKKLRTLREEAREDEDIITGMLLAKGLWSYSTRREAYIHEIQAMIKQNQLQRYNRSVIDSQ